MTHEKLNEILSISAKEHEVITYAEPDYAYIHRELSKKGVTLTLLWSEYCERCYQYTVRRLTKFAINNKKPITVKEYAAEQRIAQQTVYT